MVCNEDYGLSDFQLKLSLFHTIEVVQLRQYLTKDLRTLY